LGPHVLLPFGLIWIGSICYLIYQGLKFKRNLRTPNVYDK
jgi:hypothetical protein